MLSNISTNFGWCTPEETKCVGDSISEDVYMETEASYPSDTKIILGSSTTNNVTPLPFLFSTYVEKLSYLDKALLASLLAGGDLI